MRLHWLSYIQQLSFPWRLKLATIFWLLALVEVWIGADVITVTLTASFGLLIVFLPPAISFMLGEGRLEPPLKEAPPIAFFRVLVLDQHIERYLYDASRSIDMGFSPDNIPDMTRLARNNPTQEPRHFTLIATIGNIQGSLSIFIWMREDGVHEIMFRGDKPVIDALPDQLKPKSPPDVP